MRVIWFIVAVALPNLSSALPRNDVVFFPEEQRFRLREFSLFLPPKEYFIQIIVTDPNGFRYDEESPRGKKLVRIAEEGQEFAFEGFKEFYDPSIYTPQVWEEMKANHPLFPGHSARIIVRNFEPDGKVVGHLLMVHDDERGVPLDSLWNIQRPPLRWVEVPESILYRGFPIPENRYQVIGGLTQFLEFRSSDRNMVPFVHMIATTLAFSPSSFPILKDLPVSMQKSPWVNAAKGIRPKRVWPSKIIIECDLKLKRFYESLQFTVDEKTSPSGQRIKMEADIDKFLRARFSSRLISPMQDQLYQQALVEIEPGAESLKEPMFQYKFFLDRWIRSHEEILQGASGYADVFHRMIANSEDASLSYIGLINESPPPPRTCTEVLVREEMSGLQRFFNQRLERAHSRRGARTID